MPSTRYAILRADAKKRGIPLLLTREQFDLLWGEPCVYCGARIEGIGLDRVDSTGPYSRSNVVPCCWLCNTWKSHLTIDEFRAHLLRVYRVLVLRLPPQDDTPVVPSRRKDRVPVTQPYDPIPIRRLRGRPGKASGRRIQTGGRPQRFSPRQVFEALRRSDGRIDRAAALLGCSRRTIERYIRRYPDVRPVSTL